MSLDAVYRVMSFIVLGILLLLSAYAYRRLGATTERNGATHDAVGLSSALMNWDETQDTRGVRA